MSNDSVKRQDDAWESVVSYLFAYALGVLDGEANSKRMGESSFEELPEGYSLAYSRFDRQVGDALLRKKSGWYIYELKRDQKSFDLELGKDRVLNLKRKLEQFPGWQNEPLLAIARSAHKFLYLRRQDAATNPTLVQSSYLDWLLGESLFSSKDERQPVPEKSFVSFLRHGDIENPEASFSFEQLVKYVSFMNSREGASDHGDIPTELEDGMLVMAIDIAGEAILLTKDEFLKQVYAHKNESKLEDGQRENDQYRRHKFG